MLYLSSSCSSKRKIGEALRELIDLGVRNIELSGNLLLYPGWEEEVISLKKKYNLNFLVHNYFPPLEESPGFVMNLAAREERERILFGLLNVPFVCQSPLDLVYIHFIPDLTLCFMKKTLNFIEPRIP